MYATAQNATAYSDGPANSLMNDVSQSTAFDTVQSAAIEVTRIEDRLYAIKKKLVGDNPEAALGKAETPLPSGLLGELEGVGRTIHRSVFRMDEMLSAIERALP